MQNVQKCTGIPRDVQLDDHKEVLSLFQICGSHMSEASGFAYAKHDVMSGRVLHQPMLAC